LGGVPAPPRHPLADAVRFALRQLPGARDAVAAPHQGHMKLRVVHRTIYAYGEAVTTSHHEARLTPRESEHQRTLSHEIDVQPVAAVRRRRCDYFGNRTLWSSLNEPHESLTITAVSVVDVRIPPQLDL